MTQIAIHQVQVQAACRKSTSERIHAAYLDENDSSTRPEIIDIVRTSAIKSHVVKVHDRIYERAWNCVWVRAILPDWMRGRVVVFVVLCQILSCVRLYMPYLLIIYVEHISLP